MSTIDLIILGILYDRPMNAYELINFVEKRNINRFLKISKQAIYKSCKRLFAGDHINGKTVRDGNAPEKVIYSVNKKGEEYFYQLMQHYATGVTPIYFEFNTFLWNIEKLEHKNGLELLKKMKNELDTILHYVVIHEREDVARLPFAPRMIVKGYRMMYETLVVWLAETIDEFEKLKR